MLVVTLIAIIIGVLTLGYRATQGRQRADSILRWAIVPVYVGTASFAAIGFMRSDDSELWSGFGIVVLACSFGAGALSRSFGRQLGPRRAILILRNAYAGQTLGAGLCAVQAAIYGKAIGVFLAIVAVSVGTLWLWLTIQLTRAIAAQSTSDANRNST
jgi:hypothetical protein